MVPRVGAIVSRGAGHDTETGVRVCGRAELDAVHEAMIALDRIEDTGVLEGRKEAPHRAVLVALGCQLAEPLDVRALHDVSRVGERRRTVGAEQPADVVIVHVAQRDGSDVAGRDAEPRELGEQGPRRGRPALRRSLLGRSA